MISPIKYFKSWLVGNFSVAKSCINDNDFCEISWGDTERKIERERDKETESREGNLEKNIYLLRRKRKHYKIKSLLTKSLISIPLKWKLCHLT